MNVGEISKAIVACITAGGGSLIAGLADGHLTTAEIVVAVVTAAIAAGAVFSVTNATPTRVTVTPAMTGTTGGAVTATFTPWVPPSVTTKPAPPIEPDPPPVA